MRFMCCLLWLLPGIVYGQEINRIQVIDLLRLPTQLNKGKLNFQALPGFFVFVSAPDDPLLLSRIEKLRTTCRQHPERWRQVQELIVLLHATSEQQALQQELTSLSTLLREQLERRPLLVDHRLSLVHVLVELKQYQNAKWIARTLVEQYPENANAWGALGAALEKEQANQAVKAYLRAIELEPNEGNWHVACAVAHCHVYQQFIMDKAEATSDEMIAHRFKALSDQWNAKAKPAEDKNEIVPATFHQSLAWEDTQEDNLKLGKNILVKAKECASRSVELLRKHEPQSTAILYALVMENITASCIDPLVYQSAFEMMCKENQLQEIRRLIALHPKDVSLQLTLFQLKFAHLILWLHREYPVEMRQCDNNERSYRSLYSDKQRQELLDMMGLEKQLPTMPVDQRGPGEYAVAWMYINLEEFEKAEQHARKACELSPQTNSYWDLLCRSLACQKKYRECYALKDGWLRHHATAENHYTLAVVCQKLNDWKAARQHITTGLLLDPKHWRLRLADVIVDLKLDASTENIRRVAKRNEALFEDARRLQPAPSILPTREGYLTFVSVLALNGDYDRAHWLLNYAFTLDERRGDPELTKLLHIIGVVGLKPPSLDGVVK
jgi:tetratricopeptide (TPR) repeat protein